MTATVWATLGIARTDDLAAIRRAYAERLKAIDVDADPAAFIALRAAFDRARSLATRAAAMAAEVREVADEEAGEEPAAVEPARPAAAEAARPAPVEPAPVEPPAAWTRPTLEQDAQALQHLLFGDRPREAIYEEVRTLTRRILASLELENVDRRAAVETWTANIILRAVPRSNAMLDLAIVRFGWAEAAREWRCPPVVRAVMDRYADAQFFDGAVRGAGSPHHAAYRALGGPPEASRGLLGRPPVARVKALLQRIDSQNPTLIREFAPADVAAWRDLLRAREQRPVARLARRWRDGRQRVHRGMTWLRGNRWRWYTVLFLAPFLPFLLVLPFSADTAGPLFSMGVAWDVVVAWGVVVGLFRRGIRRSR